MALELGFSLYSRLNIKLKGCHFDTIKAIVVNRKRCLTPPQNTTSRINFKKGRSAGNGAYARKGTSSRAIVTNGPKVIF
jgi:hypothetical protein